MPDNTNGQIRLIRTIGLIVALAVIVLGWGVALGVFSGKLDLATEKAKIASLKAEEAQHVAIENSKQIIKIQGDISYIKTGIDDIKIELKK